MFPDYIIYDMLNREKTMPTNDIVSQAFVATATSRGTTNTALTTVSAASANILEWSSSPNLPPQKRSGHSMVVYNNKLVMFAGIGTLARNDAFTYDTTTPLEWLVQPTTGTIPASRYGQKSSIIGNSMIMFGGFDGAVYYSAIQKLDLLAATPVWTTPAVTGTVATARYGHVQVVLGGLVHIWGGQVSASATSTTVVRAFNTTTNAWTAPLSVGAPATLTYSAGATNGTLIYFFGGQNGSGVPQSFFRSWPGTLGAWNSPSLTSAPSVRSQHAMEHVSGFLYVYGGRNGAGVLLNDLYRYSIAGNNWTTITFASSPGARRLFSMNAIGTDLYVFGGNPATATNEDYRNDTWKIDTSLTNPTSTRLADRLSVVNSNTFNRLNHVFTSSIITSKIAIAHQTRKDVPIGGVVNFTAFVVVYS